LRRLLIYEYARIITLLRSPLHLSEKGLLLKILKGLVVTCLRGKGKTDKKKTKKS